MLRVKHEQDKIPVFVTVNGVFKDPFNNFEVHELEDHLAYLRFLLGYLTRYDILRVRNAKELVSRDDIELLNVTATRHIEEAFSHMVCLLNSLARLIV